MHNNKDLYHCRVCGAEQSDAPWGDNGEEATFNICDCCGVEFGYEDSTLAGIRRYREKWLAGGGKWLLEKSKPDNWLLDEQLAKIPKDFL